MLKQHALNILRAWMGRPRPKTFNGRTCEFTWGTRCAARRNVPLRHFNLANRRFPFPRGTGLGLAISKRFCQMMGGDIMVESFSGFSQQYISGLEGGHRNPTIVTVYQLAVALGVSHLDLMRPTGKHAK